jgi:hypothetical protein
MRVDFNSGDMIKASRFKTDSLAASTCTYL